MSSQGIVSPEDQKVTSRRAVSRGGQDATGTTTCSSSATATQQIYNRNRAAMSRCGIQIRGRSRKLYLNYRTTEEIRRQAVSLLEGCDIDDLDDGHDENRRYKSLSHGAAPLVVTEPTLEAALARSLGLVGEWVAGGPQPTTTCVVAPTRAIRDTAETAFRGKGMKTHVVEANRKDTSGASVVRFSTMPGEGFEFDQVLVLALERFVGPPVETSDERAASVRSHDSR